MIFKDLHLSTEEVQLGMASGITRRDFIGESLAGADSRPDLNGSITHTWESALASADVFDYIEMFYNRIRRHSHLDGASPEAFEGASKWRQDLVTI